MSTRPSRGWRERRGLLALRDPPTAVFCSNDRMAVGRFWAIATALSGAPANGQKQPIAKLECPLVERDSIRRIG